MKSRKGISMDAEDIELNATNEKQHMDVIPVQNRLSLAEPLRPEGGNLDKIRDILFGPQARDYEKRFARLEDRLLKEATELRDDIRKRYEALENYVKKEMESLGDRLKAEQNARTEAGRKFAYDLKEISEHLETKTAQLTEQDSQNQRELREQLLERFRTLSDEIQQRSVALSSTLERHMQELRADKTDRATLAALFTEVAMRLNNEWQFPGADAGL
jgi:hypothetical protein